MIKRVIFVLTSLCLFSIFYACKDRIFNNPLDPDKDDTGYQIESIITLAEGLIPIDMTFSGDALWILDHFSRVYSINYNSGNIIRKLSLSESSIKGIAYDGNNLWCINNTLSQIIQINIVNGEDLKTMGLPTGDYHSIDYFEDKFYIANHLNNSILIIDRETGENLGTINYPSLTTDGLAVDSNFIWTVQASTASIYRIDKIDQKEELFRSPTDSPSALCYFQGSIWCGDNNGKIYKIKFF